MIFSGQFPRTWLRSKAKYGWMSITVRRETNGKTGISGQRTRLIVPLAGLLYDFKDKYAENDRWTISGSLSGTGEISVSMRRYVVTQSIQPAIAGIFLVLASTVCYAQATAGPNRPVTVPEEYLVTPFGYFHPSCVRHMAEGSRSTACGGARETAGSGHCRVRTTGVAVDGSASGRAAVASSVNWSPKASPLA